MVLFYKAYYIINLKDFLQKSSFLKDIMNQGDKLTMNSESVLNFTLEKGCFFLIKFKVKVKFLN